MAFTTFRIIWDTIVIILEGVPSHLNVDYIKEALMKIEDVYSVEDLNIWSLTSGKPTAIVHIQLSMLLTINAGVGGLYLWN